MKKMSKAGKFGLSPRSVILGLVLMIILFNVLGVVIPEVNFALSNLSADASGAPFISIFASNGLIILAIMASVVLAIVAYIGLGGGRT